ncbi:MAG: aminoacyl-tRNA hydrolase [Eubacterium sp.]|nr:aminoacyl-tRNA hydrolase [Eubacterium sp.]
MILIAGLGNPTLRYKKTRHNIGFDTIDRVADTYGIRISRKECRALTGNGMIAGQKVLLVKPQTYMNLSGESIGDLVQFYKLDPETEVVILYDDIHLPPGQLRIRTKGSAGGHNGIKNIIQHLGTEKFQRIRVGVGEVPADRDQVSHVLSRFNRAERQQVEAGMEDAVQAVKLIVAGRADEAMNRYNRKNHID